MNIDFANKWVAALRSGEYGQAAGVLHRITPEGQQDEFCCLGVACKLLADEGKIRADEDGPLMRYDRISYTLGNSAANAMGVDDLFGSCGSFEHIEGAQAWLALDERFRSAFVDADGVVLNLNEFPKELSALNDRGVKFDAIADFIEEFKYEL